MTSKKVRSSKSTKSKEFDKYWYYQKSVQNPQNEVEFLSENFKKLRKRKAKTLREDFCGTAMIACKWTEQGQNYESWGVDLDPEPIDYGKAHHFAELSNSEQKRMHYILGNVLESPTPTVDITFAFNFSYFIFKQRSELLTYFKAAYDSLNEDGIFFVDIFGGPESQTLCTDVIEHPGFKYYWECQRFNPLNNDCRFTISFKRKGEKKRKDVFVYNWRFWSISEIKDIMQEAGFSKTITFWEGEDGDGGGNGDFFQAEEVENCEAWVTYIAALK